MEAEDISYFNVTAYEETKLCEFNFSGKETVLVEAFLKLMEEHDAAKRIIIAASYSYIDKHNSI